MFGEVDVGPEYGNGYAGHDHGGEEDGAEESAATGRIAEQHGDCKRDGQLDAEREEEQDGVVCERGPEDRIAHEHGEVGESGEDWFCDCAGPAEEAESEGVGYGQDDEDGVDAKCGQKVEPWPKLCPEGFFCRVEDPQGYLFSCACCSMRLAASCGVSVPANSSWVVSLCAFARCGGRYWS